MTWQPIESAPKDGTEILIAYDGSVSIAFFHTGYDNWRDENGVKLDWDPDWFDQNVTHWMPLPEPPKGE